MALSSNADAERIRLSVDTPDGVHTLRLRRVPKTPCPSISWNGQIGDCKNVARAELWRGRVRGRSWMDGWKPGAAASVVGNRLYILFPGRRGRLYQLVGPRTADSYDNFRLTKVRRTRSISCGNGEVSVSAGVGMARGGGQSYGYAAAVYDPARTIEIATDADYEFYVANGDKTLALIESTINAAEAIYTSQLGLTFDHRTHNTFTCEAQPYRSRKYLDLLGEFQDFTNTRGHLGAADIYHLFTGKSVSAGVIGLAYLGTACRSSEFGEEFGFSFTQLVDSALQALVFAHEIGHNLGARHPEEAGRGSDPSSLMSGVVQPGNTSFSEFSIGEIADYVDTYGSCIGAAAESVPAVSPSVSSFGTKVKRLRKKEKVRLSSDLVTAGAAVCCQYRLWGARKKKTLQSTAERERIGWLLSDRPVSDTDSLSTKVKAGKGSKLRRVFLQAELDCGGDPQFSEITSGRIRGYGKRNRTRPFFIKVRRKL